MNLRIVRKKIKSVKNVKKITKAMQLMSAVKMKKAVSLEVEGRPYRDGLQDLIHTVAPSIDTSFSPLFATQAAPEAHDLVVVISANKGLCGAFHVNILKYLLKHIDLKRTEFVTVGSKGAAQITRFDRDLVADFSIGNPSTQVSAVFDLVLERFLSKKYASVKLLYTQYLSTSRSEVRLETLLPAAPPVTERAASSSETIVEPDARTLVDALIRSYVEERIRGALLSSQAVEHSARMVAMKNATDNATDVIYSLTLVGNKIRQAKITGELLDMITAKESVEQ